MTTKSKVFVLLSDGDLNEGSTWEAAMFAGQHKLRNLVAIVDWNQVQCISESRKVLNLRPLAKKWEAFGWRTREINGHNHYLIKSALMDSPKWDRRPTCIVAHTVKGKGVSWMEGAVEWHFKSPSDDELERALGELR